MLVKNPKLVFFIDALGAGLTFAVLSIVSVRFPSYFGMPKPALFILAIIALAFFMYSSRCYRLVNKNWRPFLRLIMILNASYAFLSLGLIIYHFDGLTTLGLTYFLLEIIIIFLIVYLEWRTITSSLTQSD